MKRHENEECEQKPCKAECAEQRGVEPARGAAAADVADGDGRANDEQRPENCIGSEKPRRGAKDGRFFALLQDFSFAGNGTPARGGTGQLVGYYYRRECFFAGIDFTVDARAEGYVYAELIPGICFCDSGA